MHNHKWSLKLKKTIITTETEIKRRKNKNNSNAEEGAGTNNSKKKLIKERRRAIKGTKTKETITNSNGNSKTTNSNDNNNTNNHIEVTTAITKRNKTLETFKVTSTDREKKKKTVVKVSRLITLSNQQLSLHLITISHLVKWGAMIIIKQCIKMVVQKMWQFQI